jgi:hypothetical protein
MGTEPASIGCRTKWLESFRPGAFSLAGFGRLFEPKDYRGNALP